MEAQHQQQQWASYSGEVAPGEIPIGSDGQVQPQPSSPGAPLEQQQMVPQGMPQAPVQQTKPFPQGIQDQPFYQTPTGSQPQTPPPMDPQPDQQYQPQQTSIAPPPQAPPQV